MTIAGQQYGSGKYAGGTGNDLPSVTLSALSGTTQTVGTLTYYVISAAGPNVSVSWTYSQAQGIPQGAYRVKAKRNSGNYSYDSGWVPSAATSHSFDAVAAGLAPEEAMYAPVVDVEVWVRSADGPSYQAISLKKYYRVSWGVPTVTVTHPAAGELIDTTSVYVDWDYTDTLDTPALSYRVKLFFADSLYELSTSGWISDLSGFGSYELQLGSTPNTHYQVSVEVRNENGVSASGTVSFWTSAAVELEVPDVDDVGVVYEVGLNGVGYMLYDGHEAPGMSSDQLRRERAVVSLDPPRFATSETPFSESIDRYTFVAGSDWRTGAGQLNGDREQSEQSAYYDSSGVNPFGEHRVSLLKRTTPMFDEFVERAVVAGDAVVAQRDSDFSIGKLWVLYNPGEDPDALNQFVEPTEDGTTPFALHDLASDGARWYVAGHSVPAVGDEGPIKILRGNPDLLEEDPAAPWSSVPAQRIWWAGQRICVAYSSTTVDWDNGLTAPNVFSTLNDSGAEEITGGRITLPPGWTISDVTGGGGYVWFAAFSKSRGAIYKWDLTSATPSVAWELPVGQRPIAIFWYQGQMFIRVAGTVEASPGFEQKRIVIYSAALQEGNVIPSLLCELDNATEIGTFGADDKFVYFSWGNVGYDPDARPDTDSSYYEDVTIGAINIATGGYCKWLKGATRDWAERTVPLVRSIFQWRGRTFFSVSESQLFGEHETEHVPNGWLKTSFHDKASGVDKVFDRVLARFLPLNGTISVSYSIDGGDTYLACGGFNASTQYQTSASADLGVRGSGLGLWLKFAAPADDLTLSPTLKLWQIQLHPIGKADVVLRLPIDCSDHRSGLNGASLPGAGPGAGMSAARELERLVQQRVRVQDVDWADTRLTETFEVLQVQRIPHPGVVRDRQAAKSTAKEIAVVTLRRSVR